MKRAQSPIDSAAVAAAAKRGMIAVPLAAALAALMASAAPAEPLDPEVERYRAFILENADQTLASAQALADRIRAQDLQGAQQAWLAARIGWERSEVFTAGVVADLDQKIDAWPSAAAGFHAIEARLFGAHLTDAGAATSALVSDLDELRARARQAPLTAQLLLNGTARLVYEIGENKADGGESQISGTSLEDMRNNLVGIDAAYRTVFAAALAAADAPLAQRTRAGIEQLQALVAVAELKQLDGQRLRRASEDLVLALQEAAPKLGLSRPSLEDLAQ